MKISQREARRLKKRVSELEAAEQSRRVAWASQWPNGVEIIRTTFDRWASVPVAIRTARKMKHAVIALPSEDSGEIRFVALPLKGEA